MNYFVYKMRIRAKISGFSNKKSYFCTNNFYINNVYGQ